MRLASGRSGLSVGPQCDAVLLGLSNLCRETETTPRQREPRDAATDAETCTISDSIDRSLTRDTCDCDYCDYYEAWALVQKRTSREWFLGLGLELGLGLGC